MDNTKQQQYLALIDRGIFFKVGEPLTYKLGTGTIVPKNLPLITSSKGDTIKCRSLV